jgi:hypothetical protein
MSALMKEVVLGGFGRKIRWGASCASEEKVLVVVFLVGAAAYYFLGKRCQE